MKKVMWKFITYFILNYIYSACFICHTSDWSCSTNWFFPVSCNQCIIIIIYGECRLREEPHLTPQCSVVSCEWHLPFAKAQHCIQGGCAQAQGFRMTFRSVPDQENAAVKLTTYVLPQSAQCTHGFENKFCITVWSYCVSKALLKCSVIWCYDSLEFQWSYFSYCWSQYFGVCRCMKATILKYIIQSQYKVLQNWREFSKALTSLLIPLCN